MREAKSPRKLEAYFTWDRDHLVEPSKNCWTGRTQNRQRHLRHALAEYLLDSGSVERFLQGARFKTSLITCAFLGLPYQPGKGPVQRTLTWTNIAYGLVHGGRADLEEIPMRSLALTILTMGMALIAGQARAQTYDPAFPFCAYVPTWGGGAYNSCSYYTMDQCRASAYGMMCSPNPYYAGGTASVNRKRS